MAFYRALKATGSSVLKAAYHPWIRAGKRPRQYAIGLQPAVWDSRVCAPMLDREVIFMGKG